MHESLKPAWWWRIENAAWWVLRKPHARWSWWRWRRHLSHTVVPALRSIEARHVPPNVTIWAYQNLEQEWVFLPSPLTVSGLESPPPGLDTGVIRFWDRTDYTAVFGRESLVLIPANTGLRIPRPPRKPGEELTEGDRDAIGVIFSAFVGVVAGMLGMALGWWAAAAAVFAAAMAAIYFIPWKDTTGV